MPFLFHGAGLGVASSASSILSSMLSLLRNAGVARPFSAEVGVPPSSSFLFLGVTNWLKRFLFVTDSGVRSPRILDAEDVSLAASASFLVGVWKILVSISPKIIRRLLGVSALRLSKSPRTMPSRCGVGPMNAGPCGDRTSDDTSSSSVAKSSSLLRFSGVRTGAFGGAFGVCSMSRICLRLVARFEGV